MKIEKIGNAVGGNAQNAACRAVGINRRFVAESRLDLRVIVRRKPKKYPCLCACDRIGHQSGVLDGFPGRLEQNPLLGIHERRFTGRNAEKCGIKLVDPVDETTPARVRLAGQTRFGVVVGLDVPTVDRNFCNGVRSFAEHLPKGLQTVRTSGKTAAHSRDRNRFMHFHCDVFTFSPVRLHQFS